MEASWIERKSAANGCVAAAAAVVVVAARVRVWKRLRVGGAAGRRLQRHRHHRHRRRRRAPTDESEELRLKTNAVEEELCSVRWKMCIKCVRKRPRMEMNIKKKLLLIVTWKNMQMMLCYQHKRLLLFVHEKKLRMMLSWSSRMEQKFVGKLMTRLSRSGKTACERTKMKERQNSDCGSMQIVLFIVHRRGRYCTNLCSEEWNKNLSVSYYTSEQKRRDCVWADGEEGRQISGLRFSVDFSFDCTQTYADGIVRFYARKSKIMHARENRLVSLIHLTKSTSKQEQIEWEREEKDLRMAAHRRISKSI